MSHHCAKRTLESPPLPTVQITTVDGPYAVIAVCDLDEHFAITPATGVKFNGAFALTHLPTGFYLEHHHEVTPLLDLHERIAGLDWSGTVEELLPRLGDAMRPIMAAWRKEYQS